MHARADVAASSPGGRGASVAAEFQPITYGNRLVSAQIAGFQLIETQHAPGTTLHKHSHADASVNFVIAGSLRETVGDIAWRREYRCGAGSLLFKQADEYHANVYGSRGARCLIIQPSSAKLQALVDAGFSNDSPFPSDPRPSQIVGRIYLELRRGDDLSALAIEAGILSLFSLLSRPTRSRKKPFWLTRAKEYLAEHSRQSIVLRDVAAALDVEPTELSRAFHRAHGVTPSDFVRRERTRWAAAQLSDGTLRLSDIGLRAGFVDQSHFTRTFRDHYGVTPSRYRSLTAR
jgi:AraC family transcriptional regulator